MKLIIRNFKCYKHKEFDFGTSGVVLITGVSGVGKTTIFDALYFVLSGYGSKLTTTNCSVTLEHNDIVITRSKKPNRLTLTQGTLTGTAVMSEDDAAQHTIDGMFGSPFGIVGYLSQNNTNSFINMSPSDKIQFLEKIIFKDIDINDIKTKTTNTIRKCTDNVLITTSKLEVLSSQFTELKRPAFTTPKPTYKKDDLLLKKKEIQQRMETLRNKKQRFQTELQDLEYFTKTTATIQTMLTTHTTELGELTVVSFDSDLYNMYKKNLSDVKKHKNYITIKSQIDLDKQTLETIKQTEQSELRTKYAEVESTWSPHSETHCIQQINILKKEHTDLLSLETLRKKIKLKVDHSTTISLLKKQIEDISIDLSSKKEMLVKIKSIRTVYNCPSCGLKSYIKNNEMLKLDDSINYETNKLTELETEIKKLATTIDVAQMKLEQSLIEQTQYTTLFNELKQLDQQYASKTIDSVLTTLTSITMYYDEHRRRQELKTKYNTMIINKLYSTPITSFESDITNREKNLHINFQSNLNCSYAEDELTAFITNMTNDKYKFDTTTTRRALLEKEITKFKQTLQNELDTYNTKYKQINTPGHILENIFRLDTTLPLCVNDLLQCDNNLEYIEMYNQYVEALKTYVGKEQLISDMKKTQDEQNKKLIAANQFKDKILEAESISLTNIISTINTNAQIYLDCFFQEYPMLAELTPFKETSKSQKPQLNVTISYKDMCYDLSMLSGGELAKVTLAYSLAFNDMCNCPLLLLDESFASLDSDSTTNAITHIKSYSKNKLILIIVHQPINGIFDRIIELK